MTISMPDSIYPGNIPMQLAREAVLGYADGEWPTASRLPALFPGAKIVSLTVTGATLEAAAGVDCEPGNVNAAAAADWVKRKLTAQPSSRPVAYADLDSPGYSMPEIIAALLRLGVSRAEYRVLTAHYTGQAHICSPSSCRGADGKPVGFTADGTQWTDAYPGIKGAKIDMSELADDFFGGWVFEAVRDLEVAGTGPHSVKLSWSSPGTPEPEAVHHYQVTVRHDGQDVTGYPRDVPKGANPETWQGGSLQPGEAYEALVRAVAVDGHASPWAAVTFTTPAA